MKRIASIIALFCTTFLGAQNFNLAWSLERHVDFLCSDSLEGRKAGGEGEAKAARYIFDELQKAGVVMLTDASGQDFSISTEGGNISSRNIVGIVEGSDEILRNEYIVVGAHYDGFGTNEVTVNGQKVTQIYKGADCNASGTAMLMELARLVADNSFLFPRSVIFAFFGAGEAALAGSWYFANRAFSEMDSVRAMVNLDMLGKADEGTFQLFSQVRPDRLERLMDLTALDPVVTLPKLASGSIASSDHLPFYELSIPVFFFTKGISRDYHSYRDTPEKLDCQMMEYELNYIFHFLRQLSLEDEIERVGEESKAAEDKIYDAADVDSRPQFFHSNEQHFLDSWVYKYLKYPRRAVANGVQGTVVVSFVVEKDGSLTDIKVVRSVDEDLDDEALRVVSVSPKWIAGRRAGKKVRTRVSVPVEFRLKRND